jgi:hypothetical protein
VYVTLLLSVTLGLLFLSGITVAGYFVYMWRRGKREAEMKAWQLRASVADVEVLSSKFVCQEPQYQLTENPIINVKRQVSGTHSAV